MVMARNEKLDFFKGVLMFGVVWGHAITNLSVGSNLSVGIHWIMRTYDMPLFMVLSGYFLAFSEQRKDLKTLLLDKLTTLFLPAFCWGLLLAGLRSALAPSQGLHLNPLTTLYFLWAVFFSTLMLLVVVKVFRSHALQIASCVAITIALNFIPLNLWNLSYLFPFFALGYFVNRLKLRPQKYWGEGVLLTLAFVTLLCFWKTDYTIWNTGNYFTSLHGKALLIVLFRYLIALVGGAFFVFFFSVIYDFFSRHQTRWFRFLMECGRKTLPLYILQELLLFDGVSRVVVWMTGRLGYNPLVLNGNLLGYVIAPVLAWLLMFLIVVLVRLLDRNRFLQYAFGGKIPLSSNKNNRIK